MTAVRRRPGGLLAPALVAVLLGGCSAVPTGPFEQPEIYPDRTTPEAAWETFGWAWKIGDVVVLQQVLGGWLKSDLEKELAKNGPTATSLYYRRDAADVVVDEARWIEKGDAIAYLRVVLRSSAVPRVELDFAFTGRGTSRPAEDWVVTGKKLVR